MKKFKKLCGVVMSAMLLCTMLAANAFAVDQNFTVTGDAANSSIPVTKYLVIDKEGVVPSATFSFKLESDSSAGGATADGTPIYPGVVGTTGEMTLSFAGGAGAIAGSADDGITDSADKAYAKVEGNISLAGATFTKPGVYRYTLKETEGTDSGISYNDSTYTVDVYVGYAEGASTMSILEVLIKNKDDKKMASAQFINEFGAQPLKITKEVTGNMGDKTRAFNFTLSITAGNSLTEGTQLKAVITAQNNTTSETTVTVGKACNFSLKHGESLVIPYLPEGTSYTVSEEAVDGYTTTVNGVSKEAAGGNITVDGEMTATGNTEAFVNNLGEVIRPDTGLNLDFLPYIVIFVLAIGGIALFLAKKRKNVK